MSKISIVLILMYSWLNPFPSASTCGIQFASAENPKLLRPHVGQTVELNCAINLYHLKHLNNSRFHWYYMFCKTDFGQNICYDQQNDNWERLDCKAMPCGAKLVLNNVTGHNSGIYMCKVYPYVTNSLTVLQIRLVKFFQVEIEDSSLPLPSILDTGPHNKSFDLGEQIVLPCKAFSKTYLIIKWFRRLTDSKNTGRSNVERGNDVHTIAYFQNQYELLKSPQHRAVSENIYLSKLILKNASKSDVGYYACVVINYRGFRIQEVYLNAKHVEGLFMQYILLFLIPVSWVIPPLMMLICFMFYRKQKKKRHSCRNNSNKEQINSCPFNLVFISI